MKIITRCFRSLPDILNYPRLSSENLVKLRKSKKEGEELLSPSPFNLLLSEAVAQRNLESAGQIADARYSLIIG